MSLPRQYDRHDQKLSGGGSSESAAVVKVETTTSRNGVHAQEFTLSKTAEAALQVEAI